MKVLGLIALIATINISVMITYLITSNYPPTFWPILGVLNTVIIAALMLGVSVNLISRG